MERLEYDLYDLQLRCARMLAGDPPLSSELALVALDRQALEQGFDETDLARAAEVLPGTTAFSRGAWLEEVFRPDGDGKVRGITVVLLSEQGFRPTPPLLQYMEFRGIAPEEVELRGKRLQVGDTHFTIDEKGRVFPLFPNGQQSSLEPFEQRGILALLLRCLEGFSTSVNRLAPVSLAHLPEVADRLQGRFTLLGTFLKSGESLEVATPMGRMVALELHASLLDGLLSERLLAPLPLALDLALTLSFLMLLCLWLPGRRAAGAAGVWLFSLAAWLALNQGLLALGFFAHRAPLLLVSVVALPAHLLAKSRRLSYLLAGFGGQKAAEQEREVEATICFTNLPTYIKELEKTDVERSHSVRCAYAYCLGRVIERHQGRLMDAQGDAQMIAFGIDGEPNHAALAAACALELVTEVRALLKSSFGQADAGVFCGIFSGPVALGLVGGGSYRSISAIGDTTNAAARLMGQAKKFGRPVLAPRITVEKIGPRVRSQPVGEVSVKGRKEPIQVEEIQGFSSPPAPLLKTAAIRPPKAPWTAVAVAVLLSTLAALWLDQNLPLNNAFLDTVTPSSRGAPILWARIDEASLEAHPWPWPRSWHARAMTNCHQAGASCVFFDVLFEKPTEPHEDQALLAAVTGTPGVVVAAVAQANPHFDEASGVYHSPLKPHLLGNLAQTDHWALINSSFINQDTDLQLRYALWELNGFSDAPELVGPGVAQAVCRVVAPHKGLPLKGKRYFPIRWGPRPAEISYLRLLDPEDPILDQLQGTVVVVGDGLQGPSDSFATPVGKLKGAQIQSLAIQTVLAGDLLQDLSESPLSGILALVFAAVALRWSLYSPGFGHQLSVLFGSLAAGTLLTLAMAQAGYFVGSWHLLAGASGVLAGGLLRMLNISQALTGYVPHALQEKLDSQASLKDRDILATVMVTDIRGYTTLSEGRSPVELLGLLNRYHELTAACYEAHGGHLLTYQGDAQIVVFGAVEPLNNPALSAYRAACSIAGVLESMSQVFRVGAGITTGTITLSLIRAGDQLQYTVVGEPVRNAHHLQSQSDQVGSSILLDHETYLAVRDTVHLDRHLDEQGAPFYTC